MAPRQLVGAVAAPAAFVALLLAPLPLEPRAHHLVAIFVAVLIAWVSEVVPIAVTALAIAPALVILGVTDAEAAFRYYADPLLYLFVGSFMLAESMKRHGLDRRFAHAIVSLRIVGGDPFRTVVALVVAAMLLSMWISNTATCALVMPILLGVVGGGGPPEEGRRDTATGPLLALGYVCSTAGLGTPIGTPPNLITLRLLEAAGFEIGFVEWMALGLPAALALSLVAAAVTLRPSTVRALPARGVEPFAPRPWSRGERVTAFGLGIAFVGWTLPAVVEAAGAPFAAELGERLHVGAVAIVAALPLFFARDPERRDEAGRAAAVLPWSVAARIDWGVILLFGGGISLGTQLEETGLAAALAEWTVGATGATDVWTLAAIACATTIVLSEVASNTAAANILVPLVIALARALDVPPIPPALAVGVGASIGFMLPIATAPNAMIYSTGRVPQTAMIRAGFVLDLACFAVVMVVLRVICPLMGWA